MEKIMAEMIPAQVHQDIEDIGKAVNTDAIITPRYGAPFKSIPMIEREAFADIMDLRENKADKTEVDAALQAKANADDVYSKELTYTKAEVDTTFAAYVGGHKAYQTLADAQAAQATLPVNSIVEVTNDGANNGTYQWNGTVLTKSDFDPLTQAKNFSVSYTDLKTQNIKVLNLNGAAFGLADAEDKVFLVVSNSGEYFVPNLGLSIQQTISNLINNINQLGVSTLPAEIALAFNDGNERVFGYFKHDANLMLAGLNKSVQESLNYLLARQTDIMSSMNQHAVELSKYLLPKNLSINATQALASTIQYDANTAQHLRIDTPYRLNDSLVHPNVIELDEPMRGFKYWMCLTPYQSNNILEENPCVYGSNDLEKWELIDGIPQPLDEPPDWDEAETGEKGYLSDCWWVYDHINKELVCCWRKAYTVGAEKYNNTDIMQLLGRSTKNGLVWSEPFQIYKDTLYGSDALISPSIIFDQNVNKWRMIYMRGADIIYMRTSDDFKNPNGWSEPIDLKFGDFKRSVGSNMVAWHLEVKFLGDRLYGLITDTANMAYYLCYADKSDLTQWTYTTHNILPVKPTGKPSIYKGSFMLDESTNKIRLFWTAGNAAESRLYTALTDQI